ncbi:hypothetical protein PFISCL1PPCAC_15274, partial [Pristionchus fissidentatus]
KGADQFKISQVVLTISLILSISTIPLIITYKFLRDAFRVSSTLKMAGGARRCRGNRIEFPRKTGTIGNGASFELSEASEATSEFLTLYHPAVIVCPIDSICMRRNLRF